MNSLTKTVRNRLLSPEGRVEGWERRVGEVRVLPHRQLHREHRPLRRVVLDADRPLVVGDDAVDDGEAEAGAAALGGEVGEEKLFFGFRGDAPAGVRDLDLQMAVEGS